MLRKKSIFFESEYLLLHYIHFFIFSFAEQNLYIIWNNPFWLLFESTIETHSLFGLLGIFLSRKDKELLKKKQPKKNRNCLTSNMY